MDFDNESEERKLLLLSAAALSQIKTFIRDYLRPQSEILLQRQHGKNFKQAMSLLESKNQQIAGLINRINDCLGNQPAADSASQNA